MMKTKFSWLIYWIVLAAAIFFACSVLLGGEQSAECRVQNAECRVQSAVRPLRAELTSLADCIEATCRISAGGGRGTGCAFERSQGYVFVLTCAHVVGSHQQVQCEFWHAGHQSRPLPGRVIKRSTAADAAVVAIVESRFEGILPKIIPVAPADHVLRPGATLTSVGCANGSWSTGWKGHFLGYRNGGDLHFVPTPANGRSGSAIFDAGGSRIVGLIRARTGNNSEGIGTSVQGLYEAFAGSQGRMQNAEWRMQNEKAHPITPSPRHPLTPSPPHPVTPSAQCPGGECTPWRLLPYRHDQDEKFRQQQQQGGTWPTLPPPAAASPPVNLAPINQKLDRIAEMLGGMKGDFDAARQLLLIPREEKPEKDLQAVQAAALKEASEASQEAISEVKQESSKLRELVDGLVGDRGTLRERFQARLSKVKEELGEDAGRREIARGYVKDLAAEKLGEGKLGMTTGKVLGGALGLSGPLALALGGGLWLLSRRIGGKIEAGEPLLIERLVSRLHDRVDNLQDHLQVDESAGKGKAKR